MHIIPYMQLLTNSTISEDDKQCFALYVKDKFSASERWDMTKQWYLSKGARTIEELQCLSKLPKSQNEERFYKIYVF